jgi:hypothetical protein
VKDLPSHHGRTAGGLPGRHLRHRPWREAQAGTVTWNNGVYLDREQSGFSRVACGLCDIIFEGGATPPEARELARHRHPELTLEVYARTRTARLQALVDEVALTIIPDAVCAPGVHTTVGEHIIVGSLQEGKRHGAR